jgi:hypothetical protein
MLMNNTFRKTSAARDIFVAMLALKKQNQWHKVCDMNQLRFWGSNKSRDKIRHQNSCQNILHKQFL